MAEAYPDTFYKPPQELIYLLSIGDLVQLGFETDDPQPGMEVVGGERLWVRVTSIRPDGFSGNLVNSPVVVRGLQRGQNVDFFSCSILNLELHLDEKVEVMAQFGLLDFDESDERHVLH